MLIKKKLRTTKKKRQEKHMNKNLLLFQSASPMGFSLCLQQHKAQEAGVVDVKLPPLKVDLYNNVVNRNIRDWGEAPRPAQEPEKSQEAWRGNSRERAEREMRQSAQLAAWRRMSWP